MKVGCLPFALLPYLGVGLLCHLLFVGSRFDWSSAWTWLWLVFWPAPVALVAAAATVAGFLALLIAAWWGSR